MSDHEAKAHRDMARVLRAQAKDYADKGQRDRASFYSNYAISHEIQATKEEESWMFEGQIWDLVFLLAKEVAYKDWELGHSVHRDNPYRSTIIIQHPFAGRLAWDVPTRKIPKWMPVWQGEFVSADNTQTPEAIAFYLRREVPDAEITANKVSEA